MKPKHFFFLFLLALALRLFRISDAGFWYDESFTVIVARRALPDLFVALSGDTHPPLYYLIVWGWIRALGQIEMIQLSMLEWYVRLPSVIFSLAGLYTFWKVCQGWEFSPKAEWIAVGFMAITPFQIHYAQEARMYALFQWLVLWSVLMIQRRNWIGLGLVNLAILYTHNYGLFVLPALFLAALLSNKTPWFYAYEERVNPLTHPVFLSFVLPTLLFAPWLSVLKGQMSLIHGHYWIDSIAWGDVVDMWEKLLYGFASPDEFGTLMVMTGTGLFVWVMVRYWQAALGHARPPAWGQISLLLLTPFALAMVASYLWQPVLLFRGLIGSVPFFYLAAAWVIARLDRTKLLYLSVLVVPLLVANTIDYYLFTFDRKGNLKDDIQTALAEYYEPGMTLLHVNDGSFPGWQVYAPDIPQYRSPDCEVSPKGALTPTTRRGLGWEYRPIEESAPALIIWAEGPMSHPCERREIWPYIEQSEELVIYRDDEVFYVGIWEYDPHVITR